MFKLLALSLAVVAVAQDYTDTPFRWPDMLRNGGRVVQILTHERNGKPAEWNYPTWYKKYPMRFIEQVPVPPGDEVASGELVVLEYDITDKMGYGSETLKSNVAKFGALGSMYMDKFSPKHNELGLIAKDKKGKELGRYVFSLWPIGNDEIADLNTDLRQRPREMMVNMTKQLVTKNRAVTSVELSKANTWWGLPKDTKQIPVGNLNKEGYTRALKAVMDYSEGHPYFNDYEITLPDGKVKMPAVTCNSLIEYVVNKATNQKAFEDGVGKMGYLAVSVDKKKAPKMKPVSTEHLRKLISNHKIYNPHFNKDLYIVPAYYDAKGIAVDANTKGEAPDEWYIVWSSGINWRQNYMKAEAFQSKFGFKQGVAAGMNLKQDAGMDLSALPVKLATTAYEMEVPQDPTATDKKHKKKKHHKGKKSLLQKQ